MAGGGQPHADGDLRERAETYLRLLAESELRRALGLPQIRQPGLESASFPLRAAYLVLPPAAAIAGRAMRPMTPVARRVLAMRERVQGRAQPPAGPAARLAFGAASGVAAAASGLGAAVSTSVGAIQRAGWQVRRMVPGAPAHRRFGHTDPARSGLDRVSRLASDFAAASLIDQEAAKSIADGLESALAARSRIDPHWIGWAMRRTIRQQRPALPTGPVRARPLGTPVIVPSEHGPIHLVLLALVLAQDRAEVTLTGRLPRLAGNRVGERHWFTFPDGSATDDRGGTYKAHHVGSWDESRIDGALSFHPIPPPGAQWLDVTVGEGDPVRLQLAAGQPACADLTEQEPADPVERLVDAQAEGYLGSWRAAPDTLGVPDVIAALREIGAVSPDTPALRRLAALLRGLGSDPADLRDVPSGDLPESWVSVLGSRDATDGPAGVSPLAVIFPEIDQTRCVLTGLRSDPDSASLQLVGWGWPQGWPDPPGQRTVPVIWARDDTGRWHIATEHGGSFGNGHADVTLRLTPPLHPAASALEIMLTGREARAVATVPLTWQDLP